MKILKNKYMLCLSIGVLSFTGMGVASESYFGLGNKAQTNNMQSPQKQTASVGYDISCRVVGVSDGDTLTCLSQQNQQIKVRLNQIDAPEKGQGFGQAAKTRLSNYVYGKQIGLVSNGKDKYGRTIATVYHEGININKSMVADGMAWAYREYLTDNEYITLEEKARSQSIGLWSERSPIYPSDYRRMKRGEQSTAVQTKQISNQVNKKALSSSAGQCGSKRYCKEMVSCAEAKHYLNVCGVSRLDKDGDGRPCESLCR